MVGDATNARPCERGGSIGRQGFRVLELTVGLLVLLFISRSHPCVVLRAVAEALLASVRETDSVGRIGGDEFGVLFAP